MTSARGLRLSVGNASPAERASTMDEKKGASASSHSPHRGGACGAVPGDCAAPDTRENITTAAARASAELELMPRILAGPRGHPGQAGAVLRALTGVS